MMIYTTSTDTNDVLIDLSVSPYAANEREDDEGYANPEDSRVMKVHVTIKTARLDDELPG